MEAVYVERSTAFHLGAARSARPSRPEALHPAHARRVPPPDVCALLEPGCASRNHQSLIAPDVGREFVAATAEHDKVRVRKRPLETIPILFVAQRGRDEPVGASDPVVVRDDGIAIDLDRAALRLLWGERAHDRTLYAPASGSWHPPSARLERGAWKLIHRQARRSADANGGEHVHPAQ
jgi:hypothetical protein